MKRLLTVVVFTVRLITYAAPPLVLILTVAVLWSLVAEKNLVDSVSITHEDRQDLALFVTESLQKKTEKTPRFLPPVLDSVDLLLVTLYIPSEHPRRFWISSPWIDEEMSRFFTEIANKIEERAGTGKQFHDCFLKIEVKTSAFQRYDVISPELTAFHLDHGVDGLMVKTAHGKKIIFPTAAMEEGVLPSQVYRRFIKPLVHPSSTVFRFRTDAFLINFNTGDYYSVCRNQPHRADLSLQRVRQSLVDGGEFLLHHQSQSGRFGYSYNPVTDRYNPGYNILRHSGTAFTLYQLYGLTGSVQFLEGADRAMEWLFSRHLRRDQSLCYVVDNRLAKLGGAALTLLAVTERESHVGDGRDRDVMECLGAFLEHNMDADGEFSSYYQWTEKYPAPDRVSVYYPGEATFALVRLFRVTGEKKWLDSAVKAAEFLIDRSRFGGLDFLVFPDAWLMYALAELFEETGSEHFLDYGLKLADIVVHSQYGPSENEHALWGASFDYTFPRSTPAGARAEGLGALCRALRNSEQLERVRPYKEALMRSAEFQLTQQISDRNGFYFKSSSRARGGFVGSTVDSTMRIDYTQHNLSALLYVEDWLK